MYNYKLVYEVVIWVFVGISLCKEKVALSYKVLRYFRVNNTKFQWTQYLEIIMFTLLMLKFVMNLESSRTR